MKNRTILCASEGKILTDGKIYGKKIFLTAGADKKDFYELDEQEFLQKQQIALEAMEEALN